MAIEVFCRNTLRINLSATNPDGTPTDLNGYRALFTVENTCGCSCGDHDDSGAIIKKEFVIDDPSVKPQGYILLSQSDTDHKCGVYDFDIKLVSEETEDGIPVEEVNSSSGSFVINGPVTSRSS